MRITRKGIIENKEFLTKYVEQNLLKQKDEFYPIAYYNGSHIFTGSIESVAVKGLDINKSSRFIKLPNPSKKDYYACAIYARKNDFAKINGMFGYSLNEKFKISPDIEVYNAFKYNFYGEKRKPHDIPILIADASHFSEENITPFMQTLKNKYNVDTIYYKVLRNVSGEIREYFEVNCDLSVFYKNFQTSKNRESYLKRIVSDALNYFDKHFDYIYLVQADGQDICSIDKHRSKIQKRLDEYSYDIRPMPYKFVEYFANKGFKVDSTKLEKEQKSLPFQRKYAGIYTTSLNEKINLVRADDEFYRTALFYLEKAKNPKGLTVNDSLALEYPDKKYLDVRIIQEDGKPAYAKSISVTSKDDEVFATTMPLFYNRWKKLGLLNRVDDLYYINVYNELRDCSQTSFAIVQTDFVDETEKVLNELSKRYKYEFQSQPIVREIAGEPKECFELSLDLFSNSEFRFSRVDEFRKKATPILCDIKAETSDYADKNGLECYTICANGAIK